MLDFIICTEFCNLCSFHKREKKNGSTSNSLFNLHIIHYKSLGGATLLTLAVPPKMLPKKKKNNNNKYGGVMS